MIIRIYNIEMKNFTCLIQLLGSISGLYRSVLFRTSKCPFPSVICILIGTRDHLWTRIRITTMTCILLIFIMFSILSTSIWSNSKTPNYLFNISDSKKKEGFRTFKYNYPWRLSTWIFTLNMNWFSTVT